MDDLSKRFPFLALALKGVSLLAAILYFGGWVYITEYYSHFGIDLALLDLSWTDVLVYGASSLWHGLRHAIVFWPALAVASLWLLSRTLFSAAKARHLHFRMMAKRPQAADQRAATYPSDDYRIFIVALRAYVSLRITFGRTRKLLISLAPPAAWEVAFAIVIFATLISVSRAIGDVQARDAWQRGKTAVEFSFRVECKLEGELKGHNDKGELYPVAWGPKWIFVTVRPTSDEPVKQEKPESFLEVHAIPTGCITSFRRIMQNRWEKAPEEPATTSVKRSHTPINTLRK